MRNLLRFLTKNSFIFLFIFYNRTFTKSDFNRFSLKGFSKMISFSAMSEIDSITKWLTKTAKKPQKTIKMCVLGLDNAGKTTILKSLSNEDIQYVMPTQGFNIKSLNKGNFKFNAWDLGG